jgi:hypothetical protein
MNNKKILYFGYGANAHKDMIKALVGRVPRGFKARLDNYGLFIQPWSKISSKAKKTLKNNWDKKFSSYIAVPLKGSLIWGTAWEITKEERAIIGKWELHYKWYFPRDIKIFDEKNRMFNAQTEIILKYSTKKSAIQDKAYPNFPNSKSKMLKLAREDRKEFLKNQRTSAF